MKLRIYLVLLLSFFSSFALASDEVWIDVRSSLEHKFDNIEGDIRVSHGEIVDQVLGIHPDKDTPIALYCLSGGRASMAMQALEEAGYTHVRNVGGISDARRVRGIE